MKKFKLVAGVFLFFIQSLTCSAYETIFVLDFNSLPSAQGGFEYSGLNSGLIESQVFSVDGTQLVQNSLAAGFQGQGDNRYKWIDALDQNAVAFTLIVSAKLIQEDNSSGSNSGHNHAGFAFGFQNSALGIGGHALLLSQAVVGPGHDSYIFPPNISPFDFHTYRLEVNIEDGSYALFIDDVDPNNPILSGVSPDQLGSTLVLGDSSGGANAHGVVNNFVFIQQFATTLSCTGPEAPFDNPISIKNKSKRAIPIIVSIHDADGLIVTSDDIDPPVINVIFNGTTYGDGVVDDGALLPNGAANTGNSMNYNIETQMWEYILGTGQFSTTGGYEVKVVSGDPDSYLLDEGCTQTFERLE